MRKGLILYLAVLAVNFIIFAGVCMAEEKTAETAKPEISIKFLYFFCNDIAAVKDFYTGSLGLQEMAYRNDAEWGWLTYQCDGLELVIFRAAEQLPVLNDWAVQPGWDGGTQWIPSWSILVPEKDFAARVRALIDAGVPTFSAKPLWCMDSYWSFPVRDPMGNTVEVYTMPAAKPESTEWPD